MTSPARLGRVTAYDAERGLGTLEALDPPSPEAPSGYPFHCTAITDGSRKIEVGTLVAFVVDAGLGGAVEARSVRPVGRPVSSG